ncbi:nitroreductase/quinone reductase family protein [Streptomyces mesophilus]|uniref:nitroreductase/quinone reductase family protein n=1 Tax=Streptomyces mesophilus TaxID=1775132 RepID=UPI00332D725F
MRRPPDFRADCPCGRGDRNVTEASRPWRTPEPGESHVTAGPRDRQLRPFGRGARAGRHILVASGSAITHTHPHWYLNLVAEPQAQVQILGERFAVRARTAEGAERERLWRLMTELAPVYRTYEARSRRTIPVVVLERVATGKEPS